jgi:hypothetical protein
MQSRIKTDSPINGHFCRIFNFAVVLFLTWIAYTRGYAQTHFDNYDHAQGEYNNSLEKTFTLEKRSFMETESAASTWFDVTYYRLALEIFTQPNSLQGKVTVVGTCRDSATSLSLDLVNQMHIDSVRVDGRTMPFTQNSDWFTILLPRLYSIGEILSVDIFYKRAMGSLAQRTVWSERLVAM